MDTAAMKQIVGRYNGRVGQTLVSETDRVRVWMISLQPGECLPAHCHVLDYFWTATSHGKARSRFGDGKVIETTYAAGSTKHFSFGRDEWMVHDLCNIGDTILSFVTVEFVQSANEPLPI